MRLLSTQNTEIRKQEIKKSGVKFNDRNDFIIHNDLRNIIVNQITDIIQEIDPFLG